MTEPGGLGRHPHPETPRAAALYSITAHPSYAVTSMTYRNWYQRIYLDQGNTGTCVAHAAAHREGDYPVPIGGITEDWARTVYLEATGDTSLQEGTSALAVCRVLAARGDISDYRWITTPDEMRNALLTVGSVMAGIDWYRSFDAPVAKYGSVYIDWDPNSGIRGGHEVLIDGINLAPASGPPYYWLKNSWGQGWAHNGRARIACSSLETLLFEDGGDAVVVTEVRH